MDVCVNNFFGAEENIMVVRGFVRNIGLIDEAGLDGVSVLDPLRTIFRVLVENTEDFDRYCPWNIEHIGTRFMNDLKDFPGSRKEERSERLVVIFVMAYRFVCELEFSRPGNGGPGLAGVNQYVNENLGRFPDDMRRQLVYANYMMPADVVRKMLHSPALAEFKKFAEISKKASSLKEEWDQEIKAKTAEIEVLRQGLDRVATEYNFVGLVKGFERLASSKTSERNRSFCLLLVLSFLMVVPVGVELYFVWRHVDVIGSYREVLLYLLPPLVALEIILMYFFRVVLFGFRGVEAQLLQINLRVSLCQFIQSYAEYSSKIKQQDSDALSKFENLIFSGIVSDASSIPSTFDGVDHIAKLVSSMRAGK